MQTSEPETQAAPAVQICRYLLEMFSVPFLRSHATVCLVDSNRLQLWHANRSVILVSSAINFLEEEGLNKFIAVIVAFRRLSFAQNGILDFLSVDNANLTKKTDISQDDKMVLNGNKLVIPASGSEPQVTLTLGEVIYRDPAVIGRSTAVVKATITPPPTKGLVDKATPTDPPAEHLVVEATSTNPPAKDLAVKETSTDPPPKHLVVKVSWPGSGRYPENKFLEAAIEEAGQEGEEWALNHLPKVIWSRDVGFVEDSTLKSVARLFQGAKFVGNEYVYEPRTLRIIVQEELYPLKSLTNARDIGQVFVDIACSM